MKRIAVLAFIVAGPLAVIVVGAAMLAGPDIVTTQTVYQSSHENGAGLVVIGALLSAITGTLGALMADFR